ncbi:MAG: DivIVA domain-containing protein [Clostridia bacterium]|nr:DivIVA domain-containing protein [Clostridia bacterium]
MMTPQEVASHAFPRATLGGYNMSMVDDFLDLLTEDYTALYNDNAILKNKLKVLSDTIEEYRATDDAMRKTLLAAQKMADSMVADAESKKASLVADAEEAARQRINELQAEIAAEEYRLQAAQQATADYVAELVKLYEGQRDFLAGLSKLAPKVRDAEFKLGDTMSDIEDAMSQITAVDEPEVNDEPTTVIPFAPAEEEPEEAEAAEPVEETDADDTRVFEDLPNSARFDNLQFGKDYEIK